MAHRHTRTEVGVAQSLRGEALHKGAHDGVASRIPACRDYAHAVVLLADRHEGVAVVKNTCVNVEAVNGVDAKGQNLLGILLAAARRSGENSHVDVLQFPDVLHHFILCQFGWLVLCTVTAHNACNLEII